VPLKIAVPILGTPSRLSEVLRDAAERLGGRRLIVATCATAAQPRRGPNPRISIEANRASAASFCGNLPLLQRKQACTSRRLRVMAPSGPACIHLAMRIPRPLAILVVLVSTVLAAGAVSASPERDKASPAQAKLAAIPEIEFYLARGDANFCGRGCNEWIAAEGKIDLSAAQRLGRLLTNLGARRPPIYFHSPGGSVLGSIALGRLIRARKLEAGVAHTVPFGCDRDKPWENSCEAQKRSGRELRSDFDPTSTICNSGCVFALAGGVVRMVPPGIKLGIHDVGLDPAKGPLPGDVAVKAKRLVYLKIQEYLRDMGIDRALFTAAVAVPNNSQRFLEREELVRFRIDRREFGETSWRFIEHPRPGMSKRFFVRVGNEQPRYVDGLVSLDCASRQEIRVVLARQLVASDASAARPSSISVSGRRIELPYQTSSHDFHIRSARLAGHAFDAVEDDTKFEVPGIDPARADEPAGNMTLTMDGFSRAYAKLQGSCEQVSPPAQLTVGTSNYNPSTNPNCRPGGDQLQCLQGVPGLRSSTGQSPPPNVFPSVPSANVIHTVPIRPDQTRTTGYKPEPKQSGANPVQTVELTRAVAIDHKLPIDFIYAINPDCSSIGLASVRVIGQPDHGNIAVENGTGYSNFPPENQRYECNKRKSQGISVVYEPHPGFTGTDSITLDIIFPQGLEVKRHYSIDVK
jgi:hypothetical protein